jgi:hypothetical protein
MKLSAAFTLLLASSSFSAVAGDAIQSPYSPPGPVGSNNCLQDSWLDNNPSGGQLVCNEKIASFMQESLQSEPTTCVAGETILVNLNSVVTVTRSIFDLGWFIAADGGDGLSGSCSVNAIRADNYYTEINPFGMVSFEEEQYFGKESDTCGDIILLGEDGTGYEFEVPLGMVTMKCVDEDDNGSAEVHVCFTWRTDETDQPCTVVDSDPATVGRLADLYPGAAEGSCYCSTYEIPTITVTKGTACGTELPLAEDELSPYSPPGPVGANTCLQDSWLDNNPDGGPLVCNQKIASFALDTLTSAPTTCAAGEMIRINLNSVFTVTKSVFDLAWFIAADGGDGLTGSCSVNALRSENQYTALNSYGLLSFEDEEYLGKENDQCGEIMVLGEDGSGYDFEVPLGMVTLKCTDKDDNGIADITVCFTWRTDQTDQHCTVVDSDPATVGRLPDLYPGAAEGSCYCNTYEVPTITVTKEKSCL